jgi:hypothetical protein
MIMIDIIGWVGAILIVGAYGLNIQGKLHSDSKMYIFANLLGGICFIINTLYLKAYPSAAVNVVWVFIALYALMKTKKG